MIYLATGKAITGRPRDIETTMKAVMEFGLPIVMGVVGVMVKPIPAPPYATRRDGWQNPSYAIDDWLQHHHAPVPTPASLPKAPTSHKTPAPQPESPVEVHQS
jgi:hypothetical protein